MMNAYDNIRISGYIAAASSYDQGQDIFDAFLPLVTVALSTMIKRPTVSFSNLQRQMNSIFHVEIKKATLQQLLERLRDKGIIAFADGKPIKIRDEKYFEKNETGIEENNRLFEGFWERLKQQGVDADFEDIKEKICQWVFSHSGDLAKFIQMGTPNASIDDDSFPYALEFLDYLLDCKKNQADRYSSFLKLYNGAIQTSLLNFVPEKICEMTSSVLQVDKVILDSNFILRVLGLQTVPENDMALETWSDLKGRGTEFLVLTDTVQEIKMSIRYFLNQTDAYGYHTQKYFSHQLIRMSGLLAAVQRGVTRTNLLELSSGDSLKQKLKNYFACEVIEYDEDVSEEDIDSLIGFKNKSGYGKEQAVHDLKLIKYCSSQRDKNNRKLESLTNVQAWVLSNDTRLSYWNSQKNGIYIPECLTETQLSNLMWISKQKTSNDGLVKSMIAIASSELINVGTFSTFSTKICEYILENQNNEPKLENLAIVFARQRITNQDIQKVVNQEEKLNEIIGTKAEEEKKRIETVENGKKVAENDAATAKLELKEIHETIEKLTRDAETHQKDNNERIRMLEEKSISDRKKLKKKIAKIEKYRGLMRTLTQRLERFALKRWNIQLVKSKKYKKMLVEQHFYLKLVGLWLGG